MKVGTVWSFLAAVAWTLLVAVVVAYPLPQSATIVLTTLTILWWVPVFFPRAK